MVTVQKISLELKKLNELFKDEPNVVIVKGVQQVNQDDGSCVPAQSKGKYPIPVCWKTICI